jgi:dihydrofolate reductase
VLDELLQSPAFGLTYDVGHNHCKKGQDEPVIMGRKTFESIGRPLPKRVNIVVSRGFEAPEGVVVVGSLAEAYAVAEASLSDEQAASRCFVMGGGQIYAQSMSDVDRLVVTHVHTVIEDADTFFPEIDPAVWRVEGRSEVFRDEESGYEFEFVEYVR